MINLLNSIEPLQKIGQQELNGVQAYKIAKMINAVSKQLELYNKTRQELLNQYAQKDENNNLKIIDNDKIVIIKDKINEFNNKLEQLNNLQIELNINMFDLNDLHEIKLSPREFSEILWLINEKNPSQ